ncbi:MAG: nucleotide sugar dehydrogenase [Candidatus Omnitrophica bacterium]|nr:nucleotide sugar dehydrogenase [Candidatus Omnitrophota bacterium]
MTAHRTEELEPSSVLSELAQRIATKTAQVGVIGLGYVGLPLAVEFANVGFSVTGFELDAERAQQVNAGRSYILDVTDASLASLRHSGRLAAVGEYDRLAAMDCILICVPTPLGKARDPNISFILSGATAIAERLRPGQLVILESTTYPGTTNEVILPLLQRSGLEVGREFCLAFSPERIDPGNVQYPLRKIPKVVGGITPACQQLAIQLYRQILQHVVPVSSTKVAEMVKLLENTFRAVNIGLANELALLCDKFGVDSWEVIEAAKTKPFGFMAFYPGPGIGGHCIPKDPMYLAWKARCHGFQPRFIELADQINRQMPHYVVEKISQALNRHKKPINGSHIFLIGLTYKKDVNDTRESPAFEVAQELSARGARLSYFDPYVPSALLNGAASRSVPVTAERLQESDCVVILSNHSQVDYDLVLEQAAVVVDTRHHYSPAQRADGRVVGL